MGHLIMEDKEITDQNEVKAPGSERIIYGANGKGASSSGSAPVEAYNTIRSMSVVRIVEAVSEGPIAGLCGGAQGIYLNDTPLQNSAGTYNFNSVIWDYRVGAPGQDYMTGFGVNSEFSVNSAVTIATNNVVRTMNSDVDAALVSIQFPNGLRNQDTSTGNINGDSVQIAIDYQTPTATWSNYATFTVSGKANSVFELQYRIPRLGVGSTWDIRVRRITADATSSGQANNFAWARYTEIRELKPTYDGAAIIGLGVDAASVGNAIPIRSYLVKGLNHVAIPSNYNGDTGVYTGSWDGSMKYGYTDSAAWFIYDQLTNTSYGAGLDPSRIDLNSFYSAANYSDQLVNDGLTDGWNRRYTFNTVISKQDLGWTVLQNAAGSMRANIVYSGNKFRLIQDRPSSPVMIVNNLNIKDGVFSRVGTSLEERHNSFHVQYNERNDRYLVDVATYEDTASMNSIGYRPLDLVAFGCTSHGQALRYAKWAAYTELHQTRKITFTMGLEGFTLMAGDVIYVADNNYNNVNGRVTAPITGTNVMLSTPIQAAAGMTFSVNLPNGQTINQPDGSTSTGPATFTVGITNTTGILSSITLASTFPTAIPVDTIYTIQGAVAAEQYKILNLKYKDVHEVTIEAVIHDPNKYAWIEAGVVPPTLQFTNIQSTVVSPPTNLVATEVASVDPIGNNYRRIHVAWQAPAESVKGYIVTWQMNNGDQQQITSYNNYCDIPADIDGTYVITAKALNFTGFLSPSSTSLTYVVDSTAITTATFFAVQNLYVKGTTGFTWNSNDLVFTWTNNTSNRVPTIGYKIEIHDVSGTLLKTDTIPVTSAPEYTFSLADNYATDSGNLRSSLQVRVYARDSFSRYSPVNTVTFTNPPPAAVTNLTASGSFKSINLFWTASTDPDVMGYLVWKGTTNGFTLNSSSLIGDSGSNTYTEVGLTDTTNYYYAVGSYDLFNKNLSGTGLNVVRTSAVTTLDANNINEYAFDDLNFFPNSTIHNQLTWAPNGSHIQARKIGGSGNTTTNLTGWTVSGGYVNWTSGIIYVYYTEGDNHLSTSTNITDAVANNKIIVATYRGNGLLQTGSGQAYIDGSTIIAGSIAAGQLVAGTISITQAAQMGKATIGTAAIADAAVVNSKISGQIQSDNFVSGSTGWQINKNGTSEFSNVTARGNIQATSLNAATGTFSGTLSAATGTFGGSLSAATGTFGGSLSAATGTFSGSGSFTGALTAGAGSSISGAYIGDLTVSNGKFQSLSVDGRVITSPTVAYLTFGPSDGQNIQIATTPGKIPFVVISTGPYGDVGIVGVGIGYFVASGKVKPEWQFTFPSITCTYQYF
jgi:predicted phage tail protein